MTTKQTKQKQTKKAQVIKSNLEIKSPYKKGDFGYWWTVERGNTDICGKDFPGSITVPSYIKSLKGCPEFVQGNFNCIYCGNLKDLTGSPVFVKGNYSVSFCALKSLKGAPVTVGGDFICKRGNYLKNFKGGPVEVGGDFIVSGFDLTSLKGMPKKVGKNVFIDSADNRLLSFKGVSDYIGGDFVFLSSLKEKNIENYLLDTLDDIFILVGRLFTQDHRVFYGGCEINKDHPCYSDLDDNYYYDKY